MTKKYYQILEVSETATPEEIKQAYRKLSLKYHPDRQHGKNLEEKKQSNEKMKEINKAFEILGDEELRKRYDLGETNFTSDFAGSACEAEMEDLKEKIRRKQEEINLMEEIAKNHEESIKIMEEMWLLNAEFIDRDGTYIEISATMGFNMPRVYSQDLEENGYGYLWEGYNGWLDKVWKMPITIKMKVKEESDELKEFKKKMFKAIKEVGVILENKEKAKKKTMNDASLQRNRENAIEAIERELREKGLKVQDLGEYSNYKEQIDNLDKQWKIRSLRDKIKSYISELESKNPNKFAPEDKQDKDKQDKDKQDKDKQDKDKQDKDKQDKDKQDKDKQDKDKQDIEIDKLKRIINNFSSSENKEEWNKEKATLEKQIQNLKAQNNQEKLQREVSQLKQLVQQLEKEVKELKAEVQELKNQKDNSSEFRSYLNKKETELQSKQSKLGQLKDIIEGNNSKEKTTKSNDFPTSLVIGGIILVVSLIVILIIKSKKQKKRINPKFKKLRWFYDWWT